MTDGFRTLVPGFTTWTVCLHPGPCPCPAPCRDVTEGRAPDIAREAELRADLEAMTAS
jgi:hypothetical protein